MKISDYRCDICKEPLATCDELIGFTLKDDASEYYPAPIEKAENHICETCLNDLAAFQKQWKNRESMSVAERYAWGLSW